MDPRTTPPMTRSANLSPLMAARSRASLGVKVNFCPFGCNDEDLDDNGHCRHLVGFTTDGKTMEPLVVVKGRRVVQVPLSAEGKPIYSPIPRGAQLERITVSSRVYANVDRATASSNIVRSDSEKENGS